MVYVVANLNTRKVEKVKQIAEITFLGSNFQYMLSKGN